ncbi:hypothetical protein [Phytoactinopolyspora mesophila]|uniref:ATP/GTP-binding protein n=1 Tax=Phytoactinopolyspora mesophila TaxID=2650750 RepID=A0A7K3MAY4_9ACTN|nr:hypothetical protein [Phytoactinopolyspora mesophila]NDL60197.1 hypothetical protein [Phytoactinopolyspora mesophila]
MPLNRCRWLVQVIAPLVLMSFLAVGPLSWQAHAGLAICWDRDSGTFIDCEVTDDDDDGGGEGDDGDNDNGVERSCYVIRGESREEVPCTAETGYGTGTWSNGRQCYVGLATPQPEPDNAVWEGNYPQGAIYYCADMGLTFYGETYLFWSESSPDEIAVDPEVLAYQALTSMQLGAIGVGMAPATLSRNPDSMGLVGAPVWMWAADPSPQTWGPNTASASAGSVSVTVTAAVEEVVWDMGDGASVTCSTPGEAFNEAKGVRESSDCGYRYQRTSRDQPEQGFTVTATTYWVAPWESNTGASGTISLELTATEQVRIGERQLIEQ